LSAQFPLNSAQVVVPGSAECALSPLLYDFFILAVVTLLPVFVFLATITDAQFPLNIAQVVLPGQS
jgi:hypothetical protein